MNLRKNYNLIVNLAALALGSATFALQFKERNEINNAYEILMKRREEALAEQAKDLARREADLIERKADFALQQINNIHSKLPEITKDSVFDFISQLFESSWDFLMSIDIYQTVALLNILVITVIILTLINVFSVYLLDFYISKLQLEKRFPKLVKILKARQIFIKGDIIFNSIALILVLIYGLILNSFIFLCLN